MAIDDEKDEIQLKKAKIKVGAITCVIPELIHLNNELTGQDQKLYTILLDYIKFDGYYKFIVDIVRGYSLDRSSLMNIHFSLKKLEDGLSLLDEIRDCYIENNEMLYTGFTNNSPSNNFESFDAIGTNKINLKYVIHNQTEQEKLCKYDKNLYQNQKIAVKIKKSING